MKRPRVGAGGIIQIEIPAKSGREQRWNSPQSKENNMKILVRNTEDFSDVTIRDDNGINIHVYCFDTKEESKAFIQGFRCALSVANSAIQSIPMNYEILK
jgi:hypothetical protein